MIKLLPLLLVMSVATVDPIQVWESQMTYIMETVLQSTGPAPTPGPPSSICENCGGTGKLGDGTIETDCPVCGGDGILDKTTKPISWQLKRSIQITPSK